MKECKQFVRRKHRYKQAGIWSCITDILLTALLGRGMTQITNLDDSWDINSIKKTPDYRSSRHIDITYLPLSPPLIFCCFFFFFFGFTVLRDLLKWPCPPVPRLCFFFVFKSNAFAIIECPTWRWQNFSRNYSNWRFHLENQTEINSSAPCNCKSKL